MSAPSGWAMTDVVGGLRSRFLHDSLSELLRSGLTSLGWFAPGRYHRPLQILHGPHHWDVPVGFNTLVVTSQTVDTDFIELGSNLSRDAVEISIDIFAESDSLGLEVSNDIRDLLRGRFPFGALRGSFPILDFRQPTPSAIGYAQVDNVRVQRVVDQVPEAWARQVFTVPVTLHDTYY